MIPRDAPAWLRQLGEHGHITLDAQPDAELSAFGHFGPGLEGSPSPTNWRARQAKIDAMPTSRRRTIAQEELDASRRRSLANDQAPPDEIRRRRAARELDALRAPEGGDAA